MDRRFIAVVGVLVLAGLVLAFAFAFIVGGENGRTEDIWLVQNPPLSKTTDLPSGNGSDSPQTVMKTSTTPRPVVTTDFSNASKTTIEVKTLAHNQSAIMILFVGGKTEIIDITGDNPEAEEKIFSTEQRKQAEKIALADARVQNIIGAGMYNIDIQPLDRIQVKNSEEISANGTGVSIVFTTVNTTTVKNETTFFVHIDLNKEKVIRVSPPFPQERVTTGT